MSGWSGSLQLESMGKDVPSSKISALSIIRIRILFLFFSGKIDTPALQAPGIKKYGAFSFNFAH